MILLPRRLFWVAWDLAMGCAVGLLAGMASAGFLWLLERVIGLRAGHPWLLLALPGCGFHPLYGPLPPWDGRKKLQPSINFIPTARSLQATTSSFSGLPEC